MHIHDLFRGGAYLQKEARQAFGRFQSEGQLYDWLRELDKVLIDLYGDDGDDEERREKAVMMIVETVGGLYLTAKGRATKAGAWYMRARGDWQLAACCGEYRIGAEHVIAGRLGRDDFFLEATHQRGVMAAVRQEVGDDLSGYDGKYVDYGADVHPVFLAIAEGDLEALAALKVAEPDASLESRVARIEKHLGLDED